MEIVVKAWGEVLAKIKYIDGINYFSLSPTNALNFSPIKLTAKAQTYNFAHLDFQKGLPGLISDSLPGIYGKAYLDEFFLKHFKKVPSHLETLQFLGENTMGALTFEPSYDLATHKRESFLLDAAALYKETKKALQGDADFSVNEIIAISNSAASGARPKAIVGLNPKTDKMHVGLKSEILPEGFVHAIIKFDNLIYNNPLQGISHKENISQTKGEYIYSLIAKSLGITMSDTYLIESEGYTHFATKRFDISSVDGEIHRKHMHSLSGLMHHNPAETTFDYTNLFRVGEKLNISYSDKEQLFKTMLFNLIYGNRDDHSRNFSYLMDKQGNWRASPAYDLTFTANNKHQMMFDYNNGYDVTIESIQKIADTYGIKNSALVIEEMIDTKYTLLSQLCTQYDMKEWYKHIITSTKSVLVR